LTDERRRRLQREFVELHGYWTDAWTQLLEADPDFFEAFVGLAAVPRRSGPLDPKTKELVCVAVDGAATHLDPHGLRAHVRRALELGATREELLEVLQLTATLGIHAATVGVPVLLEAAGHEPPTELDERRRALREEFASARGYWNPFWNGLLDLDPDFFEGYLRFSAVPWQTGPLEPKVKELIYIAFDASATHMYIPGLTQHVENALALGATPAEVMEVFELASTLGMKTFSVGLPILLEELERSGQQR
jgi:alkylhydroperoxidase/carboxymuconolactone decarboxylase family protein YurZ